MWRRRLTLFGKSETFIVVPVGGTAAVNLLLRLLCSLPLLCLFPRLLPIVVVAILLPFPRCICCYLLLQLLQLLLLQLLLLVLNMERRVMPELLQTAVTSSTLPIFLINRGCDCSV